MAYSLSILFSGSSMLTRKQEEPSIPVPTYITISPHKNGLTAKTKCLNRQNGISAITPLKRKLKASSSSLSSKLLPKLGARRRSAPHGRRPSSLYSFSSFNSGLEAGTSIDTYARSTFLSLPTEVISHILYYLDYTSIQKVSRTCTKIFTICNDDDLWRKLLYADFQFIVPPSPQKSTVVTVTRKEVKNSPSTNNRERALVPASIKSTEQLSETQLQLYHPQNILREQQSMYITQGPRSKSPLLPSVNRQLYRNHCLLGRRWLRGQVKATRFLHGHEDSIYCLAWLNKNIVISGSRDRTLKVWNVKTNECIRTIDTNPTATTNINDEIQENGVEDESASNSILCVRVNKDYTSMVTGSKDATCILWSLPDLSIVHKFRGHGHTILSVCFAEATNTNEEQQEEYVITGSKDHTARVWSKQTGKELRQLIGHLGPVNSVEYAGNNRVVTASSDAKLKIWNILTGECLRTIDTRQRGGVSCMRFNGTHLFTGSVEGKIRIWNLETGECLKTMIGHIGMVRSIDYSDGKLVTGGYDRTLKVWDAQTGACILSFQSGHSSWIFSVLASGTQIISSGQERRIMVIDFGGNLSPLCS